MLVCRADRRLVSGPCLACKSPLSHPAHQGHRSAGWCSPSDHSYLCDHRRDTCNSRRVSRSGCAATGWLGPRPGAGTPRHRDPRSLRWPGLSDAEHANGRRSCQERWSEMIMSWSPGSTISSRVWPARPIKTPGRVREPSGARHSGALLSRRSNICPLLWGSANYQATRTVFQPLPSCSTAAVKSSR